MILIGDSFEILKNIESNSIQCCVTSPPYWGLRDYGTSGQLGLEKTPEEYTNNLRIVFEQVRRILKPEGTLWLNLGDSYASSGKERTKEQSVRKTTLRGGLATQLGIVKQIPKTVSGLKPKDLVGIPWRVALALQSDGWYLRQDIIWHKPNPMPESVRDRCTKSHEYIFLFSKKPKYYFNSEAILEPFSEKREGKTLGRGITAFTAAKNDRSNSGGFSRNRTGRNKRSVWTVNTKPFKGAHFATFPKDLIEPCILAGSKPGDTVLDPFFGAGTTGVVATKHNRKYVGIEINPEYAAIAKERIRNERVSA